MSNYIPDVTTGVILYPWHNPGETMLVNEVLVKHDADAT